MATAGGLFAAVGRRRALVRWAEMPSEKKMMMISLGEAATRTVFGLAREAGLASAVVPGRVILLVMTVGVKGAGRAIRCYKAIRLGKTLACSLVASLYTTDATRSRI